MLALLNVKMEECPAIHILPHGQQAVNVIVGLNYFIFTEQCSSSFHIVTTV